MKWWLTSADWWKLAADRMIKSAAQTILVALGGDALTTDITLPGRYVWIAAAAMALASLLTSIVSTPFGSRRNDPSLL